LVLKNINLSIVKGERIGFMRVAEAAKVIENTQRDVNIILINELTLIFNKLVTEDSILFTR